MAHFLAEAKASGMATLRGIKAVAKFGWTLTKPLRWPFKMVWGGMKKGAEFGNRVIDTAEWGLRWGKEAGKGVVWTGIGGSLWELTKAPLDFLKFNLLYNTRDVLKDVFTLKTPRNIFKSPVHAWEGFKEGITQTRTHISDALKKAKAFKPFAALNSTRKAIGSLMKTPFKTVWKPTRAILDTPIQMGNNIKDSFLAYPKHLYNLPQPIRKGVNRVLNAHNVAGAEMKDAQKHHFHNVPGTVGEKYKEYKQKFIDRYNKTAGSGSGGLKPAAAEAN